MMISFIIESLFYMLLNLKTQYFVQYPGVADSINSDIDNLLSVMKVWKILPDGE